MTDAAAICRLLSSVRFDLSNEKATQAEIEMVLTSGGCHIVELGDDKRQHRPPVTR